MRFSLISSFLGLIAAFSPLAMADTPIRTKLLAVSTTDLGNPHDIKLSPDGKFLLVSDVRNGRVVVLDAGTLKRVAIFGEGVQAGTHDIDFPKTKDPSERRAHVADTHNNRVIIYDLGARDGQGRPKITATLSARIRGPEGVLVHSNGRVYVAGAWSNNLVVFEKQGETYRVVNEMTGLRSPHDVEEGPDGTIWLSDAGNDRMIQLTAELKILRIWKGAPFGFSGVRYQDVLPDGTVIAADKNNHQVKIISKDGAVLHVMGDGTPGAISPDGTGPLRLRTPEGIETSDTKLYVADSGNDRILLFEVFGLRRAR